MDYGLLPYLECEVIGNSYENAELLKKEYIIWMTKNINNG